MIQMLTKEDIQKSLEDMGCSSKQVQEFVDDFENHRFEFLFLFGKLQGDIIKNSEHPILISLGKFTYILSIKGKDIALGSICPLEAFIGKISEYRLRHSAHQHIFFKSEKNIFWFARAPPPVFAYYTIRNGDNLALF